jgi:hypothetical protein
LLCIDGDFDGGDFETGVGAFNEGVFGGPFKPGVGGAFVGLRIVGDRIDGAPGIRGSAKGNIGMGGGIIPGNRGGIPIGGCSARSRCPGRRERDVARGREWDVARQRSRARA